MCFCELLLQVASMLVRTTHQLSEYRRNLRSKRALQVQCCEALGVMSSACVYIGDSPSDGQASLSHWPPNFPPEVPSLVGLPS